MYASTLKKSSQKVKGPRAPPGRRGAQATVTVEETSAARGNAKSLNAPAATTNHEHDDSYRQSQRRSGTPGRNVETRQSSVLQDDRRAAIAAANAESAQHNAEVSANTRALRSNKSVTPAPQPADETPTNATEIDAESTQSNIASDSLPTPPATQAVAGSTIKKSKKAIKPKAPARRKGAESQSEDHTEASQTAIQSVPTITNEPATARDIAAYTVPRARLGLLAQVGFFPARALLFLLALLHRRRRHRSLIEGSTRNTLRRPSSTNDFLALLLPCRRMW